MSHATAGSTTATTCSSCGAAFSCRALDPAGAAATPCWCAALPPLARIDAGRACLCPTCLERALRSETRLAAHAPRGHA